MIFFLSFILSLYTTIQPKNSVLINLLFLFVHDHSANLGVTLTLLFIIFLDVPIFCLLYLQQYYLYLSYTIFIGELLLYFVRYIHGYMKSQPHFCTFCGIQNFHLLSPVFPLNHPQSPVFCLMETKLPRQIFQHEEKRNTGHGSTQI